MNFDLFSHTILLVKAGSRAYGIHTPTSDIDVKGVCLPPPEFTVGLETFEQADKQSHFEKKEFMDLFSSEDKEIIQREKLEGTIYSLQKFLKLALDNNPNILDVLFCRDEEVLMTSPAGEKIRAARDLFISAKCKFTFSGYAFSQLNRINLHRRWLLNPPSHKPTRAEFDLPENTLIPKEQLGAAEALVKAKLDSWEYDFSVIDDEAKRFELLDQIKKTLSEVVAGINTSFSENDIKWRAAVRAVGLDDNLLDVMERERRYKAAKSEWDSFQSWQKNRNVDRHEMEAKFGYDTKHGAHLYRLLNMGKEILLTGRVNVWRGDIDADVIREIRRGGWTFDQLVGEANKISDELDEIYKNKKYIVPHTPNRTKINSLCQEVILDAYKKL